MTPISTTQRATTLPDHVRTFVVGAGFAGLGAAIKLDESGIRAVLNDFGSSVIASEDTTWLGDDIDYSAPEIKTKESHVTTMSDIYSLALTILAV